MKKRLALLLVLCLLATAVMTACGGSAAKKEKVLTVASPYGIGSLQPWISNSDGDRYVLSNIYEALMESNTGAKDGVDYAAVLAESWEYTDDLTLVVHLRQNAYWQTQDNDYFKTKTQLKAQDVKDVFDFDMDEANASTNYGDLVSLLDSVEVVDDFTIKFVTKTPTALLLKELSDVLIFPVKAVKDGYDLTKHPIGTGAYVWSDYKVDESVTLVPNKEARVKPNLDKLVFMIVPDKSVAAISLQNGEVDIVPQILTTDMQAVAAKDNLVLLPNSVGWYRYIAFNCSNEMFKDVKVRTALSICVDWEAIVDSIFGNDYGATLAVCSYGGGVPLEFEGSDLETWKANYEYDPAKAQSLLEEAGWKKNSSGIYEKGGKTLSFAIKTPANDNSRMKMGDMAVTYMKNIGVDATAQPTEWATMTADIKAGNTEMFCMGGGSVIGGMNMLFHSEGMQGTAHNNFNVDKELDALLDKGYADVHDDTRIATLKEASLKALKNKVHAGGYFEYIQVGMNKRVVDFDKSPTLWYGMCNEYRNVDVQDSK